MTENPNFGRRVIEFFDESFYTERYPDVTRSGIKPLEHYLKLGAREGRQPNRWYSDKLVPTSFRNRHPGVPPVIIFLSELPGLTEQTFSELCRSQAYADSGHDDCWACDLMRPAFDGAFYRAMYPDAAKVADALVHYCETGWKERRDPAAFFDAGYYLASNEDVSSAGINPLTHYLSMGSREGRKPAPADPVQRKLIRGLRTSSEASRELAAAPVRFEPASAARLAADLLQQVAGTPGICLSLSHDDYLSHTGGVQKFIADESRFAREDGYVYVHLYPAVPDLRLVELGAPATLLVNCTVAGRFAGTFTASELASTFEWLESRQPGALSIGTVHSVLGWRLDAVAAIVRQCDRRFFYAHDYFAICGEYRLLRNNVHPCGAPAPSSAACGICVHGDGRMRHLASFKAFFDSVEPTLVFPSSAAQQQFEASGLYMDLPAILVPHIDVTRRLGVAKTHARDGAPVRIAYCGAIAGHKGFHHFEHIVRECLGLSGLKFYHFGSQDAQLSNVEYVKTVLKDGRSSLTDLLSEHEIDIVFVGSTWAETFNFVVYEAAAAGAAIVALDGSGNVASFVDEFDIGCRVPDWRAVAELFKSKTLLKNMLVWQSNAASLQFQPNRSVLSREVQDEKQALLLHLI
jgi:hypothetical protein